MTARLIRYPLDGIKLTHDISFGVTDAEGFDVYINRAKLDKDLDYDVIGTVEELRDGRGKVTLKAPHAASDVLLILSDTLARRVTNFAKAARFEESEIDNEFDNLLRLLEDATLYLTSTPYFNPVDIGLVDGQLPALIAGGVLRVNERKDGFELVELDKVPEFLEALRKCTEQADRAKLEADRSEGFYHAIGEQFIYPRIGNISDFAGQELQEAYRLNSYQYPDNSGHWYSPIKVSTFPVTIPSIPSSSDGWVLITQSGGVYNFDSVADAVSNCPPVGSKLTVSDYVGGSAPNGSGVLFFEVVRSGAVVVDGGKGIAVDADRALRQLMKIKVDVKDYGAIAGTEQTSLIQTASDNNPYLQISADYLIEAIPGVRPQSNRTIEFLNGATLSVFTQNFGAYQALATIEVDSVDIINPRVIGDRLSNASASGEWGHCVAIIGSSNINVYNAYTQDGFGDGVYVGKNYSNDGSTFINSVQENVNVNFHGETRCYNNRRDNISVITGDVTFDTVSLTKDIVGIAPDAGLNIEPNTAKEPLSVTIRKVSTSGHKGSGVTIGLRNFNETTPFFNINITEIHSEDDRDLNMSTSGESKGSIWIGSAVIEGAKLNGLKGEKLDNAGGISMAINSLKLIGCNTSGDASTRNGSAIAIWRNTSLTTYPLGGLNVGHLYIDSPLSTNGIYFNDESSTAIAEAPLAIENLEKANTKGVAIISSSAVVVNDPNEILVKNLEPSESATYSYSTSDYKKLIRTHSTKGTTVILPFIPSGEYKGLTLKVLFRAQGFTQRVKPSGSNRIAFEGQVAGKGIDVSDEGASVTLRWNGSTEWEVINLNGSFTKEA
ncbi:hypothetical protein NVP1138O_14 [Vibrio phage 1.138.O._10N.261.48.A1]|nr:hypothetical protein NVP1138O_14 [Vibrio phage 1.138.O._10N.261.48.A1]